MKAIFVRPKFDSASSFSHLWCQRLIDAVKDKLESYIDLSEEQATRENVEKALSENPNADFCYYDHGNTEGLAEQGGAGYVIDRKNSHILKARLAYSMACLWGQGGGAQAHSEGAKAVVAYVEEFTFTTGDEQYFSEAANSGFIAYTNGETGWAKIKALMVEAFNKVIDAIQDPWGKMWARWDRDALRVYGEGADTPESKCAFRKLAVKLFGPKVGWKLSKAFPASVALFAFGLGVLIHDYVDTLYHAGGWSQVFSFQGGYFGSVILTIGFILAYYQVWRALKA